MCTIVRAAAVTICPFRIVTHIITKEWVYDNGRATVISAHPRAVFVIKGRRRCSKS